MSASTSASASAKGKRKHKRKRKHERSYDKVRFRLSQAKGKKYDAVFTNSRTGKTKTVSFGAKGMSDFTKHKDRERRARYIQRHRKREDWDDPYSAGALSRYVLWGKPSFRDSVRAYKRKFGLR